MKNRNCIKVIGAGLAGCEAALQIAASGIPVKLHEMKPGMKSPAHNSNLPAELVCSNSLKAISTDNASGVLKKEMELLGSAVIESAYYNRVPAGGALAVDRDGFSQFINQKIMNNALIEYIPGEVTEIKDDEITIVATGPLTSEKLAFKIFDMAGGGMYFFDAAAPIVSAGSIDFDKAFIASRYGKGTSDYINCPMNRKEYADFYNFLINADTVMLKDFEKTKVFEGCMPVEVMGKRGYDTLRFGPMKPVGLPDPRSGQEHFAIVQLRAENIEKTSYNLVGFQTNLKFSEQKKLLRLIPGLVNAEIERYGVMHRNTYLKSPGFLNVYFQVEKTKKLFFAGQLTGVEGYLESAATGIIAGFNAARLYNGKDLVSPPPETLTGALASYISCYAGKNFQPMNANFGILPPLDEMIKNKKERKSALAARAIESMKSFIEKLS